ncbi:OmpP1/FadL family transporter [Thiocapsa bogorovii]|uniref:OmpP1/FadL family transporter n=1 Tax=Thiocapsa bogorovii TaxID=521689 RepID=UPI001E4E947D|nr:outer membrane protein transport protein [Thiocapsa bogorovii]UHD15585.1 outer membrane protein transport protein [Thiocapsa bogorovii]
MHTFSRVGWPLKVAAIACASLPTLAFATNGYFSHGWGTKSKAMAGVATALPQDTLVTATNPAGMAFVGNSLDIAVAFFSPSPRGYDANNDITFDQNTGFPAGPFITPGRYDSENDWFLIPSFGYNYEIDAQSTIGISVFGNGGMNTDYQDRPVFQNFAAAPNQLAIGPGMMPPPGTIASPSGLLFTQTNPPMPVTDASVPPPPNGNNANPGGYLTATTSTGVNLEQLFIEFPYTFKIGNGKQSIGIAPVFAMQSFKANGLEPFRAASVSPSDVSNNGVDWSYGAGLHFGWYGEVNDQLALGMSYRTQTWMTKFDKYSGLFADGGEFNIPAMLNLGLAYKAKPNLTVAFDYQHIFYNEIAAISNSSDKDLTPCFTDGPKPSFCLGGDDGLGFGWDSMDVFKLGLRYDPNEKLSLMAGVSYNTEFAPGRQALFNILTPATVRWHLTVGAAYRFTEKDEFAFSFSYMPEEEVNGTSPSITQGQTGSIYMQQMDIQIGWNHRF